MGGDDLDRVRDLTKDFPFPAFVLEEHGGHAEVVSIEGPDYGYVTKPMQVTLQVRGGRGEGAAVQLTTSGYKHELHDLLEDCLSQLLVRDRAEIHDDVLDMVVAPRALRDFPLVVDGLVRSTACLFVGPGHWAVADRADEDYDLVVCGLGGPPDRVAIRGVVLSDVVDPVSG